MKWLIEQVTISGACASKNAKQSNNNLCVLCGEISRLPKQVRAQSVDIFLCVLCALCGFSNKKINQSPTNQRKPTQKELITCN